MQQMPHVLSTPRQRTLSAAADRIVPQDEFPSASQAGAIEYIARLLERDLPQRWSELEAGLDQLDAASQLAHNAGFADMTSDRQDELLAAQEKEAGPTAGHFFRWLVELVLESYYADPANGGNAGAVSWKMIGYDPRVPGYDGNTALKD